MEVLPQLYSLGLCTPKAGLRPQDPLEFLCLERRRWVASNPNEVHLSSVGSGASEAVKASSSSLWWEDTEGAGCYR